MTDRRYSRPARFLEHIRAFLTRSRFFGQHHTWPVLVRAGIIVLVVVGGLCLDEVTPQMLSVGIFYVAGVLAGFWFRRPQAAFALALLATFLVVIGYWITTPDPGTVFEVWTNRLLTIGTVWLTALFVWYIRILQQKLQQQIEVSAFLSREISHRVGNSLQIVASFLRAQTRGASEETRRVLEAASSRIMAIGRIERLLSHAGSPDVTDARAFLAALVGDMRSNLQEKDRLDISLAADAASLTPAMSILLGACLIELINNALKHAFRDRSKGVIQVTFAALADRFIVSVEDDGVGMDAAHPPNGFGTRNIAGLVRLMRGTISHRPARPAAVRPGTIWMLEIPRDGNPVADRPQSGEPQRPVPKAAGL